MKDKIEVHEGATATHDTAVAALLSAGMAAAEKTIDLAGAPAIVLPENSRLQVFPGLRESPLRVVQTVQCVEQAGFRAYVDTFADERSAVFVDSETAAMVAVIDYHADAHAPQWTTHRVLFNLRDDRRWKTWREKDRVWLDQATFADFLDDNADDVVKPESARLLEIVRNFKATKTLQFKSAQDAQNGDVKLVFEETTAAAGTRTGRVDIPEKIEIGIPLFVGLDAYRLQARLRYQVAGPLLQFSYALVQPEKSVRDAVQGVVTDFEAHAEEQLYRTFRAKLA